VLPAGAVEPAATAAGSDTFAPRGNYAHDPGYGWLRGRLEYSQADRRWKLRYIPVEGATDNFGGSVVIANPAAISGYERGDFVEIRGRLKSADSGDRGFAPEYEVSQVQVVSR